MRDQFKEALGNNHRRALVKGTTFADAHTFLRHIVTKHYKRDKTRIKFAFKKCGGNAKWSVDMLQKQLQRNGKYVFFGVSRSTSTAHKDQFAQLKKVAKDQLEIVKKAAKLNGVNTVDTLSPYVHPLS